MCLSNANEMLLSYAHYYLQNKIKNIKHIEVFLDESLNSSKSAYNSRRQLHLFNTFNLACKTSMRCAGTKVSSNSKRCYITVP